MSRIILPNPNLYLGSLEIERMRFLEDESGTTILGGLIQNLGFSVSQNGLSSWGSEWLAQSVSAGTQVAVAPGFAILQDSRGIIRCIHLAAQTTLALPGAGDGTYHLLAGYAESTYEKGEVTLVYGSAAVVGSGTEFTKVLRAAGSIVVQGHAMMIDSIADDTHLTLSSAMTWGTGLPPQQFSAGGWFSVSPGSGDANIIYTHDSLSLSLSTSPPDGSQLEIATVTVVGNVINSIVDMRLNNLLKIRLSTEFFAMPADAVGTTQVQDGSITAAKVSLGNAKAKWYAIAGYSGATTGWCKIGAATMSGTVGIGIKNACKLTGVMVGGGDLLGGSVAIAAGSVISVDIHQGVTYQTNVRIYKNNVVVAELKASDMYFTQQDLIVVLEFENN